MFTEVYLDLKELNFYSKLIGIVFMLCSIILVENVYLVGVIIMIHLMISALIKNFEALQMSIILIIVFMFYYLHPFLLIVVKLFLLYVSYLITKDLINIKEKKYLIDKLFYRIKTRSFDNFYLDCCYKKDLFLDNMKIYDSIDSNTRRKYSRYIIKQAEIKTNYDIQDMYYRNRLSYYKFHNKKTFSLKMNWCNKDNIFLFIMILIFILVLIYR